LDKNGSESTLLGKALMEKSLGKVLEEIKKMADNKIYSRTFVAKCLLGFEQCLKALGSDYDTMDSLTMQVWEKYDLPPVSFVTDDKILDRFGKAGQAALDEVDLDGC